MDPSLSYPPSQPPVPAPQQSQSNSRSVWVGNINFDVTEHQLREIFSVVGPVTSLRLVTHADTGKPRGFGFIEYSTAAEAASAVRNLNNYDLHGRSLKVAFSDDADSQRDGADGRAKRGQFGGSGAGSGTGSGSGPHNTGAATGIGSNIQSNPYFLNPNPTYSSSEITKLLRTLTKAEMIEILNETRRFCMQNPEGAKQLMLDTPQLAHTLLQMQILFGLVKVEDVRAMEIAAQQHAAHQAQAQVQPPIGMPPGPHAPYPGMPPHMPPAVAPPQFQPQPPPMPMNPSSVMPMGMPPMAQLPPHLPILAPGMPEPEFLSRLPIQEQSVLRELLHLTPEQIKTLPAHVQQQVHTILQQMGLPVPR